MEFEENIDFIIGYVTQCKKMEVLPQKVNDILLFIVKELKTINDKQQRKEGVNATTDSLT